MAQIKRSVFSVLLLGSSPLLLSSPPSLRRCDYVPPLSTSDLRASVCILCVRVECLVTAWWSEQLCAAFCVAQFTDSVSRWMPPFTNTASPLAAALGALLLSFLVLCEGKRRQLKWDKNKLEHKCFTWKIKRNNRKRCLQSTHSLCEQSRLNFTSLDCWGFFNTLKWKKIAQALMFRR